jgi:hypothetical protein
VAATLALCLSLSGTAYAAGQLGKNVVKSRNIAPKAVKASDLAPGAVNGSHVDEASLGTVPSAVTAQSAATATTAASVNGVREQAVRAAAPSLTTSSPVATIDGLQIGFGCGANFAVIEVRAADPADYGLLSTATSGGSSAHQTFGVGNPASAALGAGGTTSGAVTLLRANGRSVRFDFHLRYEADAMAGSNDCFLAGFARSQA